MRIHLSTRVRLALLCLTAFVVTSAAVALRATDELDRAVLTFAQSAPSYALDLISSLITITGRAEVTAVLAVVLAFVWTRRYGWSGAAPLALFAAVAIEALLKYVVPHDPPPQSALRDLNLVQVMRSAAPFAFPSGHVMRATLLAILVAERVPSTARVLAVYVLLMCVTRLYVGAHWMSDVIGGVTFGAFAALVATPAAAVVGSTLARLRSK